MSSCLRGLRLEGLRDFLALVLDVRDGDEASLRSAGHECELSAAVGTAEVCPTLSTASKKRDGRPQRALTKMLVTLAAIAQTGYTSPVAAAGMRRLSAGAPTQSGSVGYDGGARADP